MRGLLIPHSVSEKAYYVCSPKTLKNALEYLREKVALLRRKLTLETLVSIKHRVLPQELTVKIPEVTSRIRELDINLGNIENEVNTLSNVALALRSIDDIMEVFLRKFAKINIQIDTLNEQVDDFVKSLSDEISTVKIDLQNYLNSLESTLSDIWSRVNQVIEPVREILSELISQNVNDILNRLFTCKVWDFEYLRDVLMALKRDVESLRNFVHELTSTIQELNEKIKSYQEVVYTASKIHVEELDAIKLSLDDVTLDIEYLLKVCGLERRNYIISKLREWCYQLDERRNELDKYVRSKLLELENEYKLLAKKLEWINFRVLKNPLSNSLSNEVLVEISNLCKSISREPKLLHLYAYDKAMLFTELENIKRARTYIQKLIQELSKLLHVKEDVIDYIASQGYNRGIEVSDLSRKCRLGTEDVAKLLEVLAKYGLIEKKYVT